jgi:hypothetical protein
MGCSDNPRLDQQLERSLTDGTKHIGRKKWGSLLLALYRQSYTFYRKKDAQSLFTRHHVPCEYTIVLKTTLRVYLDRATHTSVSRGARNAASSKSSLTPAAESKTAIRPATCLRDKFLSLAMRRITTGAFSSSASTSSK